jgi:uroporphyrinogen III methyltransferase/synthase
MMSVLIPPDSHALAVPLENSGARVFTWPSLEIGALLDDSQLRDATENLFGYDWLILKNARAADYFIRTFLAEHLPDELDEVRVLAIGSEACDKASEFQIHVDIAVERFAANKVYGEIQSYVGDVEIARLNLLHPNAGNTCELYEQQLEADGARIDSVTAYRTCSNSDQLAKLKALLAGGGIDCVAFTTASAINEFACLFDTDDLPRLLTGVAVVCPDQSTAGVANEFGLATTMPSEPSFDQLADLINNPGI